MRFSIQWWGFSPGWRRPGHSPLCVIRARATLTVLISGSSTRCRRGLRFLLKVCNNHCQVSNGNFQMLRTTPIHIFQSWPEHTKDDRILNWLFCQLSVHIMNKLDKNTLNKMNTSTFFMNTSMFKAVHSCVTNNKNIIKCFKSLILIKPITHEILKVTKKWHSGSNSLLIVLL